MQPFARYWLHNGHVQVSGETLSKVLKNYLVIEEVPPDLPAPVLMLFILSARYRSPIASRPAALWGARAVWSRVESCLRTAPGAGDPEPAAHEAYGGASDGGFTPPRAIASRHELY